ncbi:MAG: alkaline phosphatase family protein, partial [Nitrososphaerales archaeon]
WNTSHTAYDGGKMDGFIYAQKLLPSEAALANYSMGYYTGATLPDYWDYASYYALDANFFGSQLTYTYPNRLYEVAARSNFPADPWTSSDPPLYNLTYATIINQLSQGKISWGYYTGNWQDQWDCKPFSAKVLDGQHVYEGFNTFFGDLEDFPAVQDTQPLCNHLRNTTDLMAEINSGSLPAVSWVNPNMTQSEHPGKAATLQAGQLYVSSIINAIASNPSLWKHTAIFITYDEFGGYYDQVVPPQVDQWGYGFRLPLMVISPYVHPGIYYGSPKGQPEDLSALLSTIESNWGLSPLTSRDASDAPLWYMFNFHQKAIQPLIMPSNALGVYPWTTCVERGLCQIGTVLPPTHLASPPSYRYPGVLSGAAVYNLTVDEDPGD